MDDVKFVKECESDIWNILAKMHKVGVRYDVVYFMLSEMVKTLELQGYCENWMERWDKSP